MRSRARFSLVIQAVRELVRYDCLALIGGFQAVLKGIQSVREVTPSGWSADDLQTAMRAALVLYPKPAQCLQRSAALARLMRGHGVNAELVIGYKTHPFSGHAWVELDGKIMNDSPVLGRTMLILHRV